MFYAGFSEKQPHIIDAPVNLTDYETADFALCLQPSAWFDLARLSAKFSSNYSQAQMEIETGPSPTREVSAPLTRRTTLFDFKRQSLTLVDE